jgi:hypothetical protein
MANGCPKKSLTFWAAIFYFLLGHPGGLFAATPRRGNRFSSRFIYLIQVATLSWGRKAAPVGFPLPSLVRNSMGIMTQLMRRLRGKF